MSSKYLSMTAAHPLRQPVEGVPDHLGQVAVARVVRHRLIRQLVGGELFQSAAPPAGTGESVVI